jgi:hypothetical protein
MSYAATFPSTSKAQGEDDDIYYIDRFQIEAAEKQRDMLNEVEVKYWELLKPLEEQLDELNLKVSELKHKEMEELYANLSTSQIKSMNDQRLAETRAKVVKDIRFLDEFAKFASGLARADNVELLEGLPRKKPGEDSALDFDALKIGGFDFYPNALTDTGVAVEVLRETATNHQLFSPTPPGGKFCGGFHPDLAMRYRLDGAQHHVLICLTCHELWVLREGDDTVTKFDFTTEAREVFKQTAESIFVNHELRIP